MKSRSRSSFRCCWPARWPGRRRRPSATSRWSMPAAPTRSPAIRVSTRPSSSLPTGICRGACASRSRRSRADLHLYFKGRNAGDIRAAHPAGGPMRVNSSSYFGDDGVIDLDFGTGPAVFETLDGGIYLSGSILHATGLIKAGRTDRDHWQGHARGHRRIAHRGGWLTLRGNRRCRRSRR